MRNLLKEGRLYHEGWSPVSCEKLGDEDLKVIESATIVESNYGLSCRFHLKTGGFIYSPCANTSSFTTKDIDKPVDVSKLYWLELAAVGQKNIVKVTDVAVEC